MLAAHLLCESISWAVRPASKFEHIRAAGELCVDEFEDLLFPAIQRENAVATWAEARASMLEQQEEQHALLVALRRESVLGCAELGLLPPPPEKAAEAAEQRQQQYPYIANLAVLESERRAGLGRALVDASEEVARAWGYDRIYAKVERSNFGARRLYDRTGFEIVYVQQRRSDWRNKQGMWLFLRKRMCADDSL